MSHLFHQKQRNAASKPGFFIACAKHKGGENQPDNRIRKTGNRPREGFCSEFKAWLGELFGAEQQPGREYGDDGDTHHRHHGTRHGFEDQSNDHASKNGKVEPGMTLQLREPELEQ